MRVLVSSALLSLLSGCASKTYRWTSPEAAQKLPRSLNLHIAPFQVYNPQDVKTDLKLDSAAFQAWIAPRLIEQIKRECGLDTVIVLDTISVWTDSSITVDGFKLHLSRPTGTPPAGWTLLLSSGAAYRIWGSGRGMNNISLSWVDLLVGSHYLLYDGDTQRSLAYGFAFGRTTAPTVEPDKEGMSPATWEKSSSQIAKGICKDLGKPAPISSKPAPPSRK